MEQQLTTYRAKGKSIGLVFLFKYDLNGNLKLFEISEGELDDKQMFWLFAPLPDKYGNQVMRFPAHEDIMKTVWMKDKFYKEKFEIEVSPADLSFETLWDLYGYKESKKEAESRFNKLKEADKIKCFIQVPKYKRKLQFSTTAQALLATWIHKERFNDEL